MATSSITHNFVVSNPNSVKRFVAAIDEADRDRTPKQTLRTSVNKPTGNLSFNVKKEENMSDKYFTVNIRAYLIKMN